MEKKVSILVFGTGDGARRAAKALGARYEIMAFLDNDVAKQQRPFQGRPVIPPEKINQFTWDEIHIASTSYFRPMADRLLQLGVPEAKIHAVATDILQAAPTRRCSVFCLVYYSLIALGLIGVIWLIRFIFA